MSHVAVIGLGAMGSRMAVNLLKAGHRVTVWNRTPSATGALVEAGAGQASTPREAATGADFVLSMVRDDEASRSVWLDAETGALAGMSPGAVAIESSTLSPGWIRELGLAAANRGLILLDAPVSGSRPQADAASLIFFVGGAEEGFRKAEPVLQAMGRLIHHVGALGMGSLVKLATNTMLGVQAAVLAELIGMLKRSGADPTRALGAVASTAVWSPFSQGASSAMLAGSFAPQFPAELIEKDFGYAEAAAGGAELAPTMAAVRSVYRRAMDAGLGKDNFTGIVRLFAQ